MSLFDSVVISLLILTWAGLLVVWIEFVRERQRKRLAGGFPASPEQEEAEEGSKAAADVSTEQIVNAFGSMCASWRDMGRG